MRVLGIVGSPRIGGNTDVLVDEILAGAEESGATIEKVILNKLEIKPCQACNSCYKTGKCVQEDDMIPLFDKMEQSDVLVLGTPVYWWGPTAQFKTFFDRWYNPKHQKLKGKRVIITIPLAGGSETYARHTLCMIEDSLNYIGLKIIEKVLAPGFGRRGAVRDDSNLMVKARDAGRKALEIPA
jgi:multimeric flavodoxin WrbA